MDAAIERLFPAFDELYPEVRLTLTAAERMYGSYKGDDDVPRFLLAGPYIMALERETIQFFKYKFPRYLAATAPTKAFEDYQTTEQYVQLKEMLFHRERIGLGHLVNWLQRVDKDRDDELLGRLRDFVDLLDPKRELVGKRGLRYLSERVLQYRKLCVHVSTQNVWLTDDQLEEIRDFVLLRFDGAEPGYLPRFIDLERNVTSVIGRSGTSPWDDGPSGLGP